MAKTKERTLTKAKLAHYQQLLEEKAADVRQNLGSSSASRALSRAEDVLDEEDMPGHSHEEWIFLNRNSLDVMLLRQVEQALTRIKEGSYGVCQECGEAISQRRLEAVPWASYCVPCQEQLAEEQSGDENPTRPAYRFDS